MTENLELIPSPDLVQQWKDAWAREKFCYTMEDHVAVEAARWGADQELEACCEWLKGTAHVGIDFELINARRPKPPSLKEQALGLLNEGPASDLLDHEVAVIRRALESLPDEQ